MIEAVNAVTSNAQLLRAVAEQTATTQSFSSNPARVQSAATIAPYLSPHVDLNGGSSKPIFIVRDSETGSPIRQFPTEGQIRAYQRAQDAQVRAQSQAQFDQQQAAAAAQQQFSSQQEQVDLVENSVQFRQARQQVKAAEQQAVPGAHAGRSERATGSSGGATPGKTTESAQSTSLDTSA